MESSERVDRADRANRAIIVASLTEPPATDGRDLAALGGAADWLEVRADLVGDLDPDWLRSHFPGELVYTLRSAFEGGAFEGSRDARLRRIGEAGPRFDRVDLEGERDLVPELLARIPASRRIVSWHGAPIDLLALQSRLAHLASVPAALYKLVPGAANAGEELAPLRLLAGSPRRDVIAFASGDAGFWTRILAPRLGAPVVYGSASAQAAAPGQPSVTQLRRDYGFPDMPAVRHLFGLVGWPALHSLSPRLHNAAYRALGLPAVYVPFDVEQFGDFWLELVESEAIADLGLVLGGLSITTPHKEVAFAVAGATSPLSERLQAVNTLTPRRGVWEGESTDAYGVVEALRARGVEPRGRRIAVIGCGGAGRAAALGLAVAGAEVVLANRGPERGMAAARSLGLPFVPLAELFEERAAGSPAGGGFEVYVHATPLGRRNSDELPLPVARLAAGAVVVDLVYGETPTPLVAESRRRGLAAIDGREVLLYQAIPQFRAMTGQDLPVALAGQVLGLTAEEL
ncbi:MAG: type I 3-dehydroquinate dehydratase [Thermoanaerobaculia bacterium]